MIVIDLNEHKSYQYFYEENFEIEPSVEGIINEMFKEYLGKFYQERTRDSQTKELWKQITMNIPERTVFVVKNAQKYYLTEDLHFEIVPEEFLEINPTAHMILAECFETCYRQFNELLKNYKAWKNVCEVTLPAIYVDNCNRPSIGKVEGFLENEQIKFEQILNVSLKSRMIDIVSPRIMELYRSVNLDNEPIMLIIKSKGKSREIYSVSSQLMVQKVSYLHMERQLEEIISRHVPVDSDFLVNRLYNYIMMPSSINIKPYIRIRTVNEKGINATLFTPDRQIPIVSDLQFTKVYIFALIEHNANGYPQSSYTIGYDSISIQPVSPEEGLREMKEMNETMFQDMTCCVEYIGKKYRIHGVNFDTYKKETWDAEDSLVYELKQGELSLMESEILEALDDYKIKNVAKKARKEGVYAFFKVKCS